MRLHNSRTLCSGTHVVECAIVYPVLFFFLLATLTGGMGISYYQQVAHLAREAARFASAHAGQYAKENAAAISAGTLPTVNQSYIVNNIVLPQAFMLNTANLTVQINIRLCPVIPRGPLGTRLWQTVPIGRTARRL